MIPISGRAHRKDVATEIVSKMQNSVDEFGQPLFNSNEVLEVSQIETLLSSFMQRMVVDLSGISLSTTAHFMGWPNMRDSIVLDAFCSKDSTDLFCMYSFAFVWGVLH